MVEDNKEKEQYDANLKRFIIPVLRRASYRWYARNEALKKARIERGLYKCANCGGSFRRCEVNIDHVDPVVSVEKGFTNWEDYIKRMFPITKGFQILCHSCHTIKTDLEKEMRKQYQKEKKQCKQSKKSSKSLEQSSDSSSSSE